MDENVYDIVNAVLDELGSRKGIGDALDMIDSDVYEEIYEALAEIIRSHLVE